MEKEQIRVLWDNMLDAISITLGAINATVLCDFRGEKKIVPHERHRGHREKKTILDSQFIWQDMLLCYL